MHSGISNNFLLINPRLEADTPWKDVLEIYFRSFIEFCFPRLAKEIDWQRGYDALDKELAKIYQDSQVNNSNADKLIKAWKTNQKEQFFLIHIEVQCSRDKHFSTRMYVYNYRIYDRYKVPVISIAILADGQPAWKPEKYNQKLFGCDIQMRYLLVKIKDYAAERYRLYKLNNPFAMIILAQLVALETRHNPQKRLQEKASLTRSLFARNWPIYQIMTVFKFVDWLIALPDELKLEYLNLTEEIDKEKIMGYLSTAEWVGLQKGIKKGFEEGKKQAETKIIMRLLARRFGDIPSQYFQYIEKADPDRLLTWCERILDANSIDEIFTDAY